MLHVLARLSAVNFVCELIVNCGVASLKLFEVCMINEANDVLVHVFGHLIGLYAKEVN
jgi:hypothetical protein